MSEINIRLSFEFLDVSFEDCSVGSIVHNLDESDMDSMFSSGTNVAEHLSGVFRVYATKVDYDYNQPQLSKSLRLLASRVESLGNVFERENCRTAYGVLGALETILEVMFENGFNVEGAKNDKVRFVLEVSDREFPFPYTFDRR